MKQRPILFTHSQYNFTIYLHAEILWRTYVHLALQRVCCKVFEREYTWTKSGTSPHTESSHGHTKASVATESWSSYSDVVGSGAQPVCLGVFLGT